MSEGPDRLYIERKDKDKFYDKLLGKSSPIGRHNGYKNKDIFLLAMCLGFKEKNRQKLSTREGYFLDKDLSNEEKALLYALAVSEEGDLKVLLDRKKVYSVAEEYANGGIPILYHQVFDESFGSFSKKFEADIVGFLKKTLKDTSPATA